MAEQFDIPSHCETAVIFERAIMFIFKPLTVPFYHRAFKSDAEDFFSNYCLDCSLRARACTKAGATPDTSCVLGKRVQIEDTVAVLQMPIPKHIMVLYASGNRPMFGYETANSLQPLRLGNIGSGGSWCSGDVVYNNKNPSDIYNGYMGSIHNKDLTDQSSESYPHYLQEVARDFTKINKGYPIDPDDWGDMYNIVNNPTSILWSRHPEKGYYSQEGGKYVNIQ